MRGILETKDKEDPPDFISCTCKFVAIAFAFGAFDLADFEEDCVEDGVNEDEGLEEGS